MRLITFIFLIFPCTAFAGVGLSKCGGQPGSICWRHGLGDPPGKILQSWVHDDAVYSIAISYDGKQVLTGSGDKTVVLRDALTGQTKQTWKHTNSVYSVAFSPNGEQVLTGSGDWTVVLRDALSGHVQQTWKHASRVTSATFSTDGKHVLTGSWDRTVALRETLNGKTLKVWNHNEPITAVVFSSDSKQLVTGSWDGSTTIRDILTGKILQTCKHGSMVMSVAISPDGKQLLTGLSDHSVVLRDTLTCKPTHSWQHGSQVSTVSFSQDGRYLLSGSLDRTVILRDAVTGISLQRFEQDFPVSSAAFFPNSDKVLIGSHKLAVVRTFNRKIELQSALTDELGKAEIENRLLPTTLSNRQEKLEKDKPVKDEFESVAKFNQRVANWNSAVEALNNDIKVHYATLGPIALVKRGEAFERALYRVYGNPELVDVSYDPETSRFFATLKASLDPEFKRVVSIPVPNDQARAAKARLESEKNGLEIELRVTELNELIWGQPRVRIDDKEVVAQFIDKGFIPPSTSLLAGDTQFKSIAPPSISPLPQVENIKVIDDPGLNKLQMEVLQKEHEQAVLTARQAEEKRLKDRLAELNRQSQSAINDDLPGLISKLPAPKANPRLHVLAIGINDYADVPDVPFADRSAQQFAEISQKLLGAQSQNVIVLTDSQATLGRLLSRLNTLLNRLGRQDQLLFYYAGHGVPSKDGAGAYLLAQDGGPGSYEQPDLQLGKIYSAIANSQVGQAKIFIDACFSGRSGKDSIVFEGVAPIALNPKQSFPDSDRIAVMTAGRGDQFSNQDKARGHRLFSYHLMRLILEDGSKQEIGKLHQRLKQRVLEDSRRIGPEFEQEPDFQGNGRMALQN